MFGDLYKLLVKSHGLPQKKINVRFLMAGEAVPGKRKLDNYKKIFSLELYGKYYNCNLCKGVVVLGVKKYTYY